MFVPARCPQPHPLVQQRFSNGGPQDVPKEFATSVHLHFYFDAVLLNVLSFFATFLTPSLKQKHEKRNTYTFHQCFG
jgi:hypothetical protein